MKRPTSDALTICAAVIACCLLTVLLLRRETHTNRQISRDIAEQNARFEKRQIEILATVKAVETATRKE